jgi:hypothetical protein
MVVSKPAIRFLLQVHERQRRHTEEPWLREEGRLLPRPSGLGYTSLRGITASPLLYIVLFIRRTAVEDRLLREELEGYPAYAEKVRYRLVLGLW